MAHTSVHEVLGALKYVDYPAGKDDLLQAARVAGASLEVLSALRDIPPEQYTNREDVAHSLRVDPASDLDLSPAQRAEQARLGGKAEQARLGGKQGLSQHLREVPKPPVEEELDR